jgi:hypothetical protein
LEQQTETLKILSDENIFVYSFESTTLEL